MDNTQSWFQMLKSLKFWFEYFFHSNWFYVASLSFFNIIITINLSVYLFILFFFACLFISFIQ